MNTPLSDTPPQKLSESLKPSGANGAAALAGLVALIVVKVCSSYGVHFTDTEATTIGAGSVAIAHWLHEFAGLLLNKLRS